VRWLLTQSQHLRARRIISKAAKTNGVTLSDHLLSALDEGELEEPQEKNKGFISTLKELCRSRKMLARSVNLFFNW
jgi:hypothetical protein